MILSLCLLVFPLLFFSYYSYDAIKNNIIKEQEESLASESEVLHEFVHENFQWVLSVSIGQLFSIRKVNEEQLFVIKNGISQAQSFSDHELLDLTENYIMKAGNSKKVHTFICHKNNPRRGLFASEAVLKLLEAGEGYNGGSYLERIIKRKTFEVDKYYHFYFVQGDIHYLGTITMLDDEMVICLLRDISDIKRNYDDDSVGKAFAMNLETTISAINRIDPESTNIYVFNEHRKSIVRKSSYDLPLRIDDEILEKIKQDEVWEGYIDKMNYAHAFYFQQTGWFFLYTINLSKSIDTLNSSMMIIWAISSFLVILSIFLCSYILRRPLGILAKIAKTAEYIEHADLTDKDDLEKIYRMLPDHSHDEIGILVETLKEMSGSISKNAIKLLAANAQKRRLEGELSAAKDIQIGILPESLDSKEFSPLNISALQIPAKEVGGDLYDAISFDKDHVALIIGDVSDKGVPAALFMAMTVILIRECISLKMPVHQIAAEVNRNLCQHNPNLMFVTLFIGIIDKNTGELSFANCGHCLPFLVRNGQVEFVEGISGPAIGVAPDFEYKSFTVDVPEDSNLFFYTDGVSECQNHNKDLYGVERIIAFLERLRERDPAVICSKMMEELILYRNNATQSDDITILSVKI